MQVECVVSSVPPSMIFCLMIGSLSRLLGGEPDRAGPDALRAEAERRGEVLAGRDAARGDDRRVAGDGGDGGDDREGADVAGVAGGVAALRDDGVDAGVDLALGLSRLADEAEDLDAALVRRIEDEVRAAEAEREDGDALLEDEVDLGAGAVLLDPAELVEHRRVLGRGDVVSLLHVLDEALVLVGDLGHQLLDRAARRRGRGQQEIDAEGLGAELLAEPADVASPARRGSRSAPASTPRPPACETAAATSRVGVKAKIGSTRRPMSSQSFVGGDRSRIATEQRITYAPSVTSGSKDSACCPSDCRDAARPAFTRALRVTVQ